MLPLLPRPSACQSRIAPVMCYRPIAAGLAPAFTIAAGTGQPHRIQCCLRRRCHYVLVAHAVCPWKVSERSIIWTWEQSLHHSDCLSWQTRSIRITLNGWLKRLLIVIFGRRINVIVVAVANYYYIDTLDRSKAKLVNCTLNGNYVGHTSSHPVLLSL